MAGILIVPFKKFHPDIKKGAKRPYGLRLAVWTVQSIVRVRVIIHLLYGEYAS
jgi:hypothetical protein